MDYEAIISSLSTMNPWWTSGVVPAWAAPATERREVQRFMELLEGDRVPVIAGLRRSGKTTLVHQAIGHLIEKGMRPQDLVYASLDDLTLRTMGPEVIPAIMEAHRRQHGIGEGGTRYYFLDEVQSVDDWAVAVKNVWDRRKDVRLAVTGSAGLLIRGATAESLTGRATGLELGPWELRDWTSLRGGSPPGIGFMDVVTGEHRILSEEGLIERTHLRDATMPFLGQYLVRGGLPEGAYIESELEYFRNLSDDVIERVLYRDIPTIHEVRRPDKLAKLLLLVADGRGFPLSVDSLAKAIDSHHNTVESYLSFLVSSRLIIQVPSFARGEHKRQRRMSKYYLADTGVQNAMDKRDSRLLGDDKAMGHVAEQATAIHLARLAERYGGRLHYGPSYGGRELDFILELGGDTIPIEANHRKSVRRTDLSAVKAYCKGLCDTPPVMITKEESGVRDGVVLLPLWLMLLTG
ncbi:MAG: AAA family ATPase [Thermoplasmata archaeon]|nr:AAA family ATPase [Thermoplasmata archaeon]